MSVHNSTPSTDPNSPGSTRHVRLAVAQELWRQKDEYEHRALAAEDQVRLLKKEIKRLTERIKTLEGAVKNAGVLAIECEELVAQVNKVTGKKMAEVKGRAMGVEVGEKNGVKQEDEMKADEGMIMGWGAQAVRAVNAVLWAVGVVVVGVRLMGWMIL